VGALIGAEAIVWTCTRDDASHVLRDAALLAVLTRPAPALAGSPPGQGPAAGRWRSGGRYTSARRPGSPSHAGPPDWRRFIHGRAAPKRATHLLPFFHNVLLPPEGRGQDERSIALVFASGQYQALG
jgi:hypothetical protein